MLRKHFNTKNHEEYGFTLIELLVVILIIGILAAIAIPAFLNQRQRANDGAVESDVRNAAMQVETALVADPNATNFSGDTDTSLTWTVGTESVDVVVSDGVTMTLANESTGSNTYVIEGWHSNGGQYTGSGADAAVYNSNTGGLA